jgi:hypothetical protein
MQKVDRLVDEIRSLTLEVPSDAAYDVYNFFWDSSDEFTEYQIKVWVNFMLGAIELPDGWEDEFTEYQTKMLGVVKLPDDWGSPLYAEDLIWHCYEIAEDRHKKTANKKIARRRQKIEKLERAYDALCDKFNIEQRKWNTWMWNILGARWIDGGRNNGGTFHFNQEQKIIVNDQRQLEKSWKKVKNYIKAIRHGKSTPRIPKELDMSDIPEEDLSMAISHSKMLCDGLNGSGKPFKDFTDSEQQLYLLEHEVYRFLILKQFYFGLNVLLKYVELMEKHSPENSIGSISLKMSLPQELRVLIYDIPFFSEDDVQGFLKDIDSLEKRLETNRENPVKYSKKKQG